MICLRCLSQVSSACETKRKCLEADERLRFSLENIECSSEPKASLMSSSVRQEIIAHEAMVGTMEKPLTDEDTVETSADAEKEKMSKRRSLRTRKIKQDININIPAARKNVEPSNRAEFPSKERQSNVFSYGKLDPLISKGFTCDICNFGTKRKKNLERHILAIHIKYFKFSCRFASCTRDYTTQAALKLHTVRDHDENSPFACQKCKQKFSCQSLLMIHNQRLTCRPRKRIGNDMRVIEKKFSCPHCDFKTAHQFSLKQHVKLIHLNIRRTWKCSYCDNTEFSNRISLNHHIFKVHNISHVRCDQCDQAFSTEEQLKAHRESLKCNARLATDDDFYETDTGVICNLCNRSYRSKKEWITHYFNHHKFDKICDICNIQLSTYASLKNHKKAIHDKIKPFSCTECPKKFSAKHSLEFHLNTHSGNKPFGCKWCSFKASDRSSVSKHQKKLHAGQS